VHPAVTRISPAATCVPACIAPLVAAGALRELGTRQAAREAAG
jgi:hypothetical protein